MTTSILQTLIGAVMIISLRNLSLSQPMSFFSTRLTLREFLKLSSWILVEMNIDLTVLGFLSVIINPWGA